ncbi:MAG: radical SAM protein [Treponemataceae bacterium]
MDSNGLFNEQNQEFFSRAARIALRNVFASGKPLTAARNAAKLAGIANFQRSQAEKRAKAAREGRTVPGILIASVTRKCNLNCAGCYSKTLRPDASAELSDERFMELFREAVDLGVGTLMIAGGEPLTRPSLLREAAKLPGVVMPVFTNGLLVDAETIDLFSGGRLVPIFSVEGDAAFTAERRGDGIHERVLAHAAELKRRGALFGFSVTLTSKNADSVLSDRFLREIEAMGASVLFLIEYVPVTAGSENLVLTDAQKAELLRSDKFAGYSFMPVSLPGDEEAFGGCLAAGRGFIHLADDGALEACPFAPFSDISAARLSLAEALESPLMRAIRERHGELTETKGGCALWNKRGWVASLGSCAARGNETTPIEEASA